LSVVRFAGDVATGIPAAVRSYRDAAEQRSTIAAPGAVTASAERESQDDGVSRAGRAVPFIRQSTARVLPKISPSTL
jgi:hypothetical protein